MHKKVHIDLSVGDAIGHAVIWILLMIVTIGLAYIIYIYRVAVFALNKTIVVEP